MTNYKNAKIREHMPDTPPAHSHHGSGKKNIHFSFSGKEKGASKASNRSLSSSSLLAQAFSNPPRRTKIISEEEKQMERSKHKKFE